MTKAQKQAKKDELKLAIDQVVFKCEDYHKACEHSTTDDIEATKAAYSNALTRVFSLVDNIL